MAPKAQKDEVKTGEVMPMMDQGMLSLVDLIAGGSQIVRSQIASQLVVAKLKPRDEAKVLEGALLELTHAPELAEDAWWAFPFKNHEEGCRNKRGCDCPEEMAEGGTIGTAEALIRRWGNASIDIIEDGEDDVFIRRIVNAVDFETGFSFKVPVVTTKVITKKDKTSFTLYGKQLEMALGANVSKGYRNAVWKIVPRYLRNSYINKAKEIYAEFQKKDKTPLPERIKKMVGAFSRVGAPKDMLEKYLTHPVEQTTEDGLVKLRGILTAIKAGEKSAKEAFDLGEESAPPADEHHTTVEQVMQTATADDARSEATRKADGELFPQGETGGLDF